MRRRGTAGLVAVIAIGLGVLVACQPVKKAPPALNVTSFVTGLTHPWDVAFLPDGTAFFTERAGDVKVRLPNGAVNVLASAAATLPGSPDVLSTGGEGGLMGLAVDPGFATNRLLYICFSSTADDNRVVRWRVNSDFTALEQRTDIVFGLPHNAGAQGRHSGCRPRFGPDGALWIGTGDAAMGANPQDGTSLGGKVLRVNPDGTVAPGNLVPTGFDPRIFTYGHRNVQGLAFRPGNGQPFAVEHGPGINDEVNLLFNGHNYGWNPVPGYNESVPMTDFGEFPAAIGAAWSSGSPTVAPSGATFLSGPQWKAWDGALVLATLKDAQVGNRLRVLSVDGPGTTATEIAQALVGQFGRLRTPVQGPDGALYVTTSNGGGTDQILRVAPS
jgi:glucose/arabinose dehydrogenase